MKLLLLIFTIQTFDLATEIVGNIKYSLFADELRINLASLACENGEISFTETKETIERAYLLQNTFYKIYSKLFFIKNSHSNILAFLGYEEALAILIKYVDEIRSKIYSFPVFVRPDGLIVKMFKRLDDKNTSIYYKTYLNDAFFVDLHQKIYTLLHTNGGLESICECF